MDSKLPSLPELTKVFDMTEMSTNVRVLPYVIVLPTCHVGRTFTRGQNFKKFVFCSVRLCRQSAKRKEMQLGKSVLIKNCILSRSRRISCDPTICLFVLVRRLTTLGPPQVKLALGLGPLNKSRVSRGSVTLKRNRRSPSHLQRDVSCAKSRFLAFSPRRGMVHCLTSTGCAASAGISRTTIW